MIKARIVDQEGFSTFDVRIREDSKGTEHCNLSYGGGCGIVYILYFHEPDTIRPIFDALLPLARREGWLEPVAEIVGFGKEAAAIEKEVTR